ncbi:MAG TPA: hypothetical protein VLK25_02290 [Allosphingosinicella sp.]|nr:hypothetical protein [Allosphingosinicella sp.]
MKSWIFAASSALFVAGCGGAAGTGNAAGGNAAEAPANAAVEANASAPAAATNVAIGRWTGAADKCDEMADVEFTATAIRIFGGPGGSSMDIPITYSDATATSVTMQAEPGQPTIVATVQDPTHLLLTSPGRPERNCTLARRPA